MTHLALTQGHSPGATCRLPATPAQDTRRILGDEIDGVRAEIARRAERVRAEETRNTAEARGWDSLNRVEEQLARLEGKIDRAKQALYYPAVKGFRCAPGDTAGCGYAEDGSPAA